MEQDWDNKPAAIAILKDYINHQQQRAKEVQK